MTLRNGAFSVLALSLLYYFSNTSHPRSPGVR